MKVLALDPGVTTGYVLVEDEDLSPFNGTFHGQLLPGFIWDLLMNVQPDVIVCERFLHVQRTKVDYTPVEVIGVVKEWCRQHPKTKLNFQTPAERMFFTDDRLREYGMYFKGKRHANDAARHYLYWRHFGLGKP